MVAIVACESPEESGFAESEKPAKPDQNLQNIVIQTLIDSIEADKDIEDRYGRLGHC